MYYVIYNPVSGMMKKKDITAGVFSELENRHIDYAPYASASAGDMTRLAQKAVKDGADGIIAIGGDGSFHEIVNGIGQSGIELIFVPHGTGNDFLKMFRLPKDPISALKAQLDSPVKYIDLCKANEDYFLNVFGAGFDVDVLRHAEKYKSGLAHRFSYIIGAYSAIKYLKMLSLEVRIDGGAPFTKEATIISVGNGSYIGGGMKAVPGASVFDGFIDVVIANKVSKLSVVYLLIMFILGLHVKIKSLTTVYRCRTIEFKADNMYVEADGEVYPCSHVAISVIPSGLKTRLPL